MLPTTPSTTTKTPTRPPLPAAITNSRGQRYSPTHHQPDVATTTLLSTTTTAATTETTTDMTPAGLRVEQSGSGSGGRPNSFINSGIRTCLNIATKIANGTSELRERNNSRKNKSQYKTLEHNTAPAVANTPSTTTPIDTVTDTNSNARGYATSSTTTSPTDRLRLAEECCGNDSNHHNTTATNHNRHGTGTTTTMEPVGSWFEQPITPHMDSNSNPDVMTRENIAGENIAGEKMGRQCSVKSLNIREDQESEAKRQWNEIITICRQVDIYVLMLYTSQHLGD